jgi:hypothetical protein
VSKLSNAFKLSISAWSRWPHTSDDLFTHSEYICHRLLSLAHKGKISWDTQRKAEEILHKRLYPQVSLEVWLHAKLGIEYKTIYSLEGVHKCEMTRIEWLKSLVKEFE